MSELGVLEPHELSGYSRTSYHQAVKCPLCGSLAGLELHSENLPIVGLGATHVGYGYCTDCGHIYQTTPPPADKLEEYYRRFSNYTKAPASSEPSAMTKRFLALSKDYIEQPDAMYEVGCATGAHLSHFKARGWGVRGCDPSPKACAEGALTHGVHIDCGTEAEWLPKLHDFNLILFSGVLEHLTDPVAALKRARDAMAPGARLILEVPCAATPEVLPPGWFAFEHLHYYTPTSIKNLLALGGFELIESRITYQDFIYPVITCVAKRAEVSGTIEKCPQASAEFINRYIACDDQYWAQTAKSLSGAGDNLIIYGAGVHTSQLFDRIPELAERVIYIVDRDPQKWGQAMAGKSIVSPAFIQETVIGSPSLRAEVVISSYANENQIFQDLAAMDIPESLIIRLYA